MGISGLVRKSAGVLVFGLMCGLMITGCGGGSGGGTGSSGSGTAATPSPAGTAVADYILDEENGNFTANWYVGNWAGTTPASASAYTETMAATTQPTTFSMTNTYQTLVNGTWSPVTLSNGTSYNLAPNGWALSTNNMVGNSFIDGGNGTKGTYVLANGAPDYFSISRTNLAGQAVVCPGTCTTPGTYPTGAARYSLTRTANFYMLFNLASGLQDTDQYGTALTALPAEDATTFCDPLIGTVYQPSATQMASHAWLYYVYFLASGASCTSSAISSALAAGAQQEVTITWTPTGNAYVPTVLVLTNWYSLNPSLAPYGFSDPWFYSLRAGNVWEGIMIPSGTVDSTKTRAAVNAELTASGYTPLP